MRGALLLAIVLLILPCAPAPGQEEAGPLFRQVREAVSSGDDERLYDLARLDPWGFREVTNQLSDLVVQQGGREKAADAFIRLVVAGHLGAIHFQVTGDKTLAERLRHMMGWTGYDMADRAGVDDLLARVESTTPPGPQDLEKGLPVCERLEDDRCLGLVRAGIGRVHERAGRSDLAILWYERSIDALREAGELQRLRNAFLSRGQILLALGRAAEATEVFGASAAVSSQVDDPEGRTGSLILLAEALAADGRRAAAFDALGEARRIAFSRDLPLLAARAILLRAVLRDEDGTMRASAEDYLAAARLGQQAGDMPTVIEAYGRAARVFLRAGETGRAAEVIDKGLSAARLADLDRETQSMLLMGAELDEQLGDLDRAVSRLREALVIARRGGNPGHEMRVLELLGTTLLQAGRFDAAVGPLEQARDMARQGGPTAIEGRAEGGLGAVALARGDMEAALEHYGRSVSLLEQAGDEFQAVRMRRMVEQIKARQVERPES